MKRLTGKMLLAAAGLLLGGQVWAEGEYSILEQLRPTQVKKITSGNYQLFVPRPESSSNDSFTSSRSSGGRTSGFLTNDNRGENNEPTERCLKISGTISKRGTAPMGYLAFSLQFSRTFNFRGKALKCKFTNLSDNRPEVVIVRFFKKDAQQPLWIIQNMDPAFASESEIVFDPNASGDNFKTVIGKEQANDISKIEFYFGNSENTRHNFRITALDIVQGSAAEDGSGMEGGDQMAANGSLMTRALRDRLAPGNGQVGFFENGEESFIRVRGVPGSVEGLEGSWLSFRIGFPKGVRLADQRLVFRCEGLGGVDKLMIRGWSEGAEKPAWSVASSDKAFSAESAEPSMEPSSELAGGQALTRPVEFRLSEGDPKNLTIPGDVRLNVKVRSLEFLVSASDSKGDREVRAEISGLELNADE